MFYNIAKSSNLIKSISVNKFFLTATGHVKYTISIKLGSPFCFGKKCYQDEIEKIVEACMNVVRKEKICLSVDMLCA